MDLNGPTLVRSAHPPQCFFDEKAMPSAGLVPFSQSFICTFNNTCHMHAREDFTQVQIYNDSL